MAATLQVDVVSPVQRLFSGEATEVYARSLDGEIGILANHQPALLALDIAPVKVRTAAGDEHVFAVHNGFLEMRDNRLSVLADAAERREHIDRPRAERAKQRAQDRLERDEEAADAESALARAELRLELSG
ncbi:MAG: ATP synthase F1 subunit epsilon [Actinomycetota bacterium]|nr:ATP synthase F1 subunit epsilon [Actinomycetota bacterium]